MQEDSLYFLRFHRRTLVVFLGVFFFLIYFPMTVLRPIWEPDEPRQILMTLEMEKEFGLFPTLRGDLYPDYPPLSYWGTIAFSRALEGGGYDNPLEHPWVHRFLPMMFTIFSALAVFWMGSKRHSIFTGLMAAFIVATSPMVFLQGQRAMIDPILMGWMSFFFLSFTYYLEKPGKIYFLLFFFLLLALWMTKGPVGVLLTGAIVVCYFLTGREWKRFFIFTGYFALCGSLLAAAWYGWAYYYYGERFFYEILINQTLGRFLPKSLLHWLISFFPSYTQGMLRINPDHERGWAYYVGKFPALFAPWILFFLAGLYSMVKKKSSEDRLALVWFCVVFLLFSLSKNKRTYYLLPLMPAAALLAARGIESAYLIESQGLKNYLKKCFYLLSCLLILSGIFFPLFYFFGLSYLDERVALIARAFPMALVLLLLPLCAFSGILLFWITQKEDLHRSALCLGMTLSLIWGLGWIMSVPGINEEKDYRPLCQYIRKKIPESRQVVFFHLLRDSIEANLGNFKREKKWEILEPGKLLRLYIPSSQIHFIVVPEEGNMSYGEVRKKIKAPYLLVMPENRYARFQKEGEPFSEKMIGEKKIDHRVWKVFLVEK